MGIRQLYFLVRSSRKRFGLRGPRRPPRPRRARQSGFGSRALRMLVILRKISEIPRSRKFEVI